MSMVAPARQADATGGWRPHVPRLLMPGRRDAGNPSTLDIRKVAIHEAGHALLGAVIGWGISSAVATSSGGHVSFDIEKSRVPDVTVPERLDREAHLLLAAISLAGVEAELMLAGVADAGITRLQDKDQESAESILSTYWASDLDAALFAAHGIARSAIKQCWPDVVAMADRLSQEGALSDADVSELCQGRLPSLGGLLINVPERLFK